jgi:hypothetical protein
MWGIGRPSSISVDLSDIMLTRLRESFDKQRDSATHKKSWQGATEEQPQKVSEKQACNNEVRKDEETRMRKAATTRTRMNQNSND